jgi:hypothetical protein
MELRVVCYQADVDAVKVHKDEAVVRSTAWEAPWRERIAAARPVDRTELLAEFRAEREKLVAAGYLAYSQADVLRQALDAHITATRWRSKSWDPIPSGRGAHRGRAYGAVTGNYDAALSFQAPEGDVELIRRVSYWTSDKPVRELVKWYKRWGRGPAHIPDLPPEAQAMATIATYLNLPPMKELLYRDRLRAQVLTVGQILRDVVHRAGSGPAVTQPAPASTTHSRRPPGQSVGQPQRAHQRTRGSDPERSP